MNKLLVELPNREKAVDDIIEIIYKHRKFANNGLTIDKFHDCSQEIFDYFKDQVIS